MAEVDRTEQLLRTLGERVRALDAVFAVGGSVSLPAPVRLRFEGRRTVEVAAKRYSDETKLRRRLRKECEEAPFGVGAETRRDPAVRRGDQLRAEGDALEVLGLDLRATGILEHVRRELCAGSAELPEAELHALNLYTSRGHFVRHKDTPRDRDCFGTLVVCLPVRFSGGRLVVRKDTTVAFDWESRAGFWNPEPSTEVQWAAFYGDVDHQIEPIRDGLRVTLTFLLRTPDDHSVDPPAPKATEEELEADLRAALRHRGFLRQGGTLGVPCTHLYAETEGFVRPRNALSDRAAARLKGRDRMVAFAAMRAGLRIRYRPYLHEDCAHDTWRLSRAPTEREARIFRRQRLGARMLTETMPIEHDLTGWRRKDDVTWVVPAPFEGWERECGRGDSLPAMECLGDLEYSATDYFGNEGGDSAFYVSAALLIEVPPSDERVDPLRLVSR